MVKFSHLLLRDYFRLGLSNRESHYRRIAPTGRVFQSAELRVGVPYDG